MEKLTIIAIAISSLIGCLVACLFFYSITKGNKSAIKEIANSMKNNSLLEIGDLPIYRLKRRYFDFGTYSTITDANGLELFCAVEQPWNNNKENESCVREGIYLLEPWKSPSKGSCYIISAPYLGVTKTPEEGGDRSLCLFHIANAPSELKGCIAPGMNFGYVYNQWAVTESSKAFDQFMELLDNKKAILIIEKA